jgi:hypothetical protein
VPGEQAVHTDAPVNSELKVPAPHTVHTAEVTAATTAPYAPAVHAVQADVPVVSALYAPATHPVHTADVLAVPTLP